MKTRRTRTPEPDRSRLLLRFLLVLAGLLISPVVLAAVEIAWFEAHPACPIELQWKTGSEIDLAGFYLRRSEKGGSSPDTYKRIEVEDNSHRRVLYISPGADSIVGNLYEYRDPGARAGRTYYYLLEVIDSDGGSHFYGPARAACRKKPKEDAT